MPEEPPDVPVQPPADSARAAAAAPQRASRARERYQRRREKRTTQTQTVIAPESRRAVPRAAGARGGQPLPRRAASPRGAPAVLRLPTIPYLRQVLTAGAGVVFMLLLIVGLGLARRDPPRALPNALWLGEDWTQRPQDEVAMRGLVRRLREDDIGIVFAWVSWLQSNNTWSGIQPGPNSFAQVENEIEAFVQQFNAAYPEADLYGWIQVPASFGSGSRLGNGDLQEEVAVFSLNLLNRFGFDGVFLDVDVIANGDDNYLAILRRMRTMLPEDAQVVVALPPDWTPSEAEIPRPEIIAEGTALTDAYKQRIALLADIIVVRAFNSYLEQPQDYAAWMAYQVRSYALAVDALATGTELLIGVPTYDDDPPAHMPNVETISTAVEGIRAGLDAAGEARRVFRGVAVYADWETDEDEWQAYRRAWLGQ